MHFCLNSHIPFSLGDFGVTSKAISSEWSCRLRLTSRQNLTRWRGSSPKQLPPSQNGTQGEMGWQTGVWGRWAFNWISFSQPHLKAIHHRKPHSKVQTLPQWLAVCHAGAPRPTWLASLEALPLFSLSSTNFLGLISVNLKICAQQGLLRRLSLVSVKLLGLRNLGFLFCEMGGNMDREQKWRCMVWRFILSTWWDIESPRRQAHGHACLWKWEAPVHGWSPILSIKEEGSWASFHLFFLIMAAMLPSASSSSYLDFPPWRTISMNCEPNKPLILWVALARAFLAEKQKKTTKTGGYLEGKLGTC